MYLISLLSLAELIKIFYNKLSFLTHSWPLGSLLKSRAVRFQQWPSNFALRILWTSGQFGFPMTFPHRKYNAKTFLEMEKKASDEKSVQSEQNKGMGDAMSKRKATEIRPFPAWRKQADLVRIINVYNLGRGQPLASNGSSCKHINQPLSSQKAKYRLPHQTTKSPS